MSTTVRYKKSVEPVYTDGRDIDLDVGQLSGEAADQQSSGSSDKHIQRMGESWAQLPEPQEGDPTYYDRPLLNESVWEWAVPTYYFAGGLSGASLVLGAAAQLSRSQKLELLIKRCHWIGFVGCCISGVLLIYDLGRPSRFFNMLRVFRPTSPMNIGAWILCGAGGTSMMAVLLGGRTGLLKRICESSVYASGVFGMGLATYTGVLLSNTAVPVWQESRRVLPVLFGASAMATAGSVFEMFGADSQERRVTKVFGVAGQLAELTAGIVMERHASRVARVGWPLKRGLSGAMWKTAAALTASSVVAALLPNRRRPARIAAGVLGALGSLLMRFAVERAGVASARDARASFHLQRAEMSSSDTVR